MRKAVTRPAALLLVGGLLSGCASAQSLQAGGFVRREEPIVAESGPSPSAEADKPHTGGEVAAEHARRGTFGATIEDSDPQLAAALMLETALPTAENHLRVAEQYRRLSVLDAAFARFTRAVQKQPNFSPAHEGIARAWRDWRQPELALGAAHRATYFAPDSASAQNTLGTVFDALGRYDQAHDAYSRALMLDPTAAWALNNLCYSAFRSGRLDDARLQCEAALRMQPNLATAHNNLALVYAASGDLERAREHFVAAGNFAAANYNIGIVHLAMGNHAAAAVAFEAAIRARPTFTAAKARAHVARVRLLKRGD